MKNIIVISAVIAAIVGVGAFYGGMSYGKSQAAGARNSSLSQRQGFGAGAAGGALRNGSEQGRGGNRAAGEFVNGSIIAKDDKSITIKSIGGGSKIVFLSSSTQIMKSVDGSAADLATGKNVMVTGSTNSDGSLTAQSIQLRPASPVNATTTLK